VALDPHTGVVRAWIGGRDFRDSQYDHVSQAHRQVGSLMKPFIVATALEHGLGILDLVSTLPDSVRSADGVDWAPADHVTTPILPLREALIHSSNRAAVNLGLYLGIDAVRTVGREAGIESPIPTFPSSFIGAFDASLLEMTTAYAAFDNGGLRVAPHLVERIEDADGNVLWRRSDEVPEQVMDSATSFVILDALRGVVDRGTASTIRATGYDGPAAGKTGTTNGGQDAWFIGMVPDLVAGVWVGYEQPRPIVPGASGGSVAAPAWARWMEGVDAKLGTPRGEWLPPEGVQRIAYDRNTGEAYRAGCSAGDAEEAWVRTGQYATRPCPGSLGAWILSLWHAVVPRHHESVVGPLPGAGGG
jgi:membrane peptidoglycan carboxypeptidase